MARHLRKIFIIRVLGWRLTEFTTVFNRAVQFHRSKIDPQTFSLNEFMTAAAKLVLFTYFEKFSYAFDKVDEYLDTILTDEDGRPLVTPSQRHLIDMSINDIAEVISNDFMAALRSTRSFDYSEDIDITQVLVTGTGSISIEVTDYGRSTW